MYTKPSCKTCNKEFIPKNHTKGMFCSYACFVIHRRNNSKGYMIYKGYKHLYKPDHPSANSSGYIREHRYFMEIHLNRRLESDEYVHHIDGNKLNNATENLTITSNVEHARLHGNEIGWSRKFVACLVCIKTTNPHWGRGLCKKCYEKLKPKGRLSDYPRQFKYSTHREF